MTVNEKISILRRDAGMSQDELAERLDVSRQSISKWESGKAVPDSDKIIALSEIFGVTTDFLLKDSEEFDISTDVSDEAENIVQDDQSNITPTYYNEDINSSEKKPDNKKLIKRILAVAVALCVVVGSIIVVPGILEKPISYPYILVHGLGGWGAESKINDTVPYWGNSAGNLAAIMTEQGQETYEASVGPFSSTWDRTCELYAQLTGTTVDYGESHSLAHGHERYGRQYTKPLFEGWGTRTKGGQIKKVNLVGHSFGGETVRLLASLLAYGDDAEKNASGKNVSPLFAGGKKNWINSVTTLCSPHNGSTLFYVVDQFKLVDIILGVVYAAGGISSMTPVSDLYDFRLEQFGITDTSDPKSLLNDVFSKGTDNAAYDLSPDGAAELNKSIKLVKGVYYFSYSYVTTQESKLFGTQIPTLKTNPILMLPAEEMGRYSGKTVGDFQIDETWRENDGLVNVVSARYPINDEWQDFNSEKIVKGKWNVMPTLTGDHGTVIGLLADAGQTKNFYNELYTMIDNLPRH